MISSAVGSGKIDSTNRAAGRVLVTLDRPEALIRCLTTGKDPGHMVPRERRADARPHAPTSAARYVKKAIPAAVRRDVARKYGCPPGGTVDAPCHYCARLAYIHWWTKRDGSPGSWVSFGHELDHAYPEFLGGLATVENIVLACRRCNRSKGAKV